MSDGRWFALGAVAAVAAVGVLRRRGSPSDLVYRQFSEGQYDSIGTFGPARQALLGLADPFFADRVYDFFGVEEPGEGEGDWDRAERELEVAADEVLAGIDLGSDDLVFEWNELLVARQRRGSGLGRELVQRVERTIRERGARAIFLQAGDIDDRHSLGFWRKMGYSEFTGDYGYYDDRLLYKVLS
jgi:GNAT superfamily N-acetyltransferase